MQVFVERIEPFGAFVVGCDQRFDGEGADLPGFVDLERVPDPCPQGRIRRKDVGDLQPREVECLARRGAGYRAAFELLAERGERRIAESRHHQLAVYLVGYDHDVVAQAQLPDAVQLRGRPDPSGRVVRVA